MNVKNKIFNLFKMQLLCVLKFVLGLKFSKFDKYQGHFSSLAGTISNTVSAVLSDFFSWSFLKDRFDKPRYPGFSINSIFNHQRKGILHLSFKFRINYLLIPQVLDSRYLQNITPTQLNQLLSKPKIIN
jgi:hypothetical protein